LHLVQNYREKLEQITYVDTFRQLIDKYETFTASVPDNVSFTTVDTEQTPIRGPIINGQRWHGIKDTDAEEEAYFNGSDDDDENRYSGEDSSPAGKANGSSSKPLVNYPEDDEDELGMDVPASADQVQNRASDEDTTSTPGTRASRGQTPPPPERLSEKRRREEDDEDELGKLSSAPKRRSSIGSNASIPPSGGPTLRRAKSSVASGKENANKKISISLAVKPENAATSDAAEDAPDADSQ
jgi:protein phosphatase-4 regulatory subunit 3